MRTISNRLIQIAVVTITSLLVLNFILTRNNSKIIEHNRLLQEQAETVKVTTSQFVIIIIHNLDLGLRSYALFKDEKYLYPLHIAIKQKDSILYAVERVLKEQGYPLDEFYVLRDSINAYAADNLKWLYLFQSNQLGEFRRLANMDKGYILWLQYERFARNVYRYEDEIVNKARGKYREASRNNYLIQVILFFIAVPTLLVTAYQASKKFAYEVQLRKAQEEKALLLSVQNEKLEFAVAERTKEIQDINRTLQQKNEEISAQNDELNQHREELATQNKALMESKKQQLQLYSKNLLEKSDLIHKLSEEIESLKQKSSDEEQVKKFSRVLNSTILTDEDWERFKKLFQDVYPNFFATLRFKFPEITASELRLSALIKMNLSLKEAASTLGISAESVKKSRYRLKKKIALREAESLEEFIRVL